MGADPIQHPGSERYRLSPIAPTGLEGTKDHDAHIEIRENDGADLGGDFPGRVLGGQRCIRTTFDAEHE